MLDSDNKTMTLFRTKRKEKRHRGGHGHQNNTLINTKCNEIHNCTGQGYQHNTIKVNKINHRCAHALRKISLFVIKIEKEYDIVLERCPYKIPSLAIKTKSVRYYVEPEG